MSVILIRHGEPEHARLGLTGGWTDEGLTQIGRRQSELLAARLKAEFAGRGYQMYCSDLKRALETARIVSTGIGVTAKQAPELREFNNGIAAGMTEEQAKQYFVEPLLQIIQTSFNSAYTIKSFISPKISFPPISPLTF